MEWFWELEKLKCLRWLLPQVHHLTDAAAVLETTTVLTRYVMFPQTSILGGMGKGGKKKKQTQKKVKKDPQPPKTKTRNKPCLYKALGSVPGLLTYFMMISWRGFFFFSWCNIVFWTAKMWKDFFFWAKVICLLHTCFVLVCVTFYVLVLSFVLIYNTS